MTDLGRVEPAVQKLKCVGTATSEGDISVLAIERTGDASRVAGGKE
jgi:hypothetical protein